MPNINLLFRIILLLNYYIYFIIIYKLFIIYSLLYFKNI